MKLNKLHTAIATFCLACSAFSASYAQVAIQGMINLNFGMGIGSEAQLGKGAHVSLSNIKITSDNSEVVLMPGASTVAPDMSDRFKTAVPLETLFLSGDGNGIPTGTYTMNYTLSGMINGKNFSHDGTLKFTLSGDASGVTFKLGEGAATSITENGVKYNATFRNWDPAAMMQKLHLKSAPPELKNAFQLSFDKAAS